MSKTREIIRLLDTGMKDRAIARAVAKSRTAVAHVKNRLSITGLNHEQASSLDDISLDELIYPSPSVQDGSRRGALEKLIPEILKNLGKKHETLQHQWELYRQAHPDGYEYSQFCFHLGCVRKKDSAGIALHHEYGDLMFVDFAGDKLSITNPLTGEVTWLEVFVAILPASRLTYVECLQSQKVPDWIQANDNALHYIGGVPRGIVPDCLKSAVTKAHIYESEKNPQYVQFAEHYDTVILPARPGTPRDKALVENAVNNIYRYIYPRLKERTYHSVAEINQALHALLERFNSRTMRAYGCSRWELFNSCEKAALKALPGKRYEFKKYQAPRQVSYGIYVYLREDKHYYSVPERYGNKKCAVFYNATSVEIHCDHIRIATHMREKGVNKFTTKENHLSVKYREHLKWTPERLVSWAFSIGEDTGNTAQAVINRARHPMEAVKTCLYIMSMGKRYGNDRLENACRRALRFGAVTGKKIERILEKGLDQEPDEQQVFHVLPKHENIRYGTDSKEDVA